MMQFGGKCKKKQTTKNKNKKKAFGFFYEYQCFNKFICLEKYSVVSIQFDLNSDKGYLSIDTG